MEMEDQVIQQTMGLTKDLELSRKKPLETIHDACEVGPLGNAVIKCWDLGTNKILHTSERPLNASENYNLRAICGNVFQWD